jgi:hypothetical protein
MNDDTIEEKDGKWVCSCGAEFEDELQAIRHISHH